MSKHNLLNKKIKKQFLTINDLIESNFNKLKYFKSNYKKILFSKDNRVFLIVGGVAILTLFYFLIPTFFNKDIIQTKIKNQIFRNYDVNIKFNEKIYYGLLPKPHFSAKNLSILLDDKEIGITKNLKVYIGLNNFLSVNDIEIKDLVFNKADFSIDFSGLKFFEKLLKTEPNEHKIIFKKSNIFFKNKDEEVLFINKIYNGKFYYDSINLQNVLDAKNEIFKVPYKISLINDKFNKKFYAKFNSNKIRLNINNEIDYENKFYAGIVDILFINKNTSFKFKIDNESFDFSSDTNKNSYEGFIDFKPFYLYAKLNYEGISTKNLFNHDSIFIDLMESEVFGNNNLSASIDLEVKDITNINELNNLFLKISLEDGKIRFSESKILWKDDLKITLNDSFIIADNNEMNLLGTLSLDFKNIDNFYSSFQIPKKNRKKIKKIELDFIYNFQQKSFRFENAKVDTRQNSNLESFLSDFNLGG